MSAPLTLGECCCRLGEDVDRKGKRADTSSGIPAASERPSATCCRLANFALMLHLVEIMKDYISRVSTF